MSELKACPFCGGAASDPTNESKGRPVWIISCYQFCISMRRNSKSEVIECWNTRKPEPGQPAAVQVDLIALRENLASALLEIHNFRTAGEKSEFIKIADKHIDSAYHKVKAAIEAQPAAGQSEPVAYLYDYIDEMGVYRSKLTFVKWNPADIEWAGRTEIVEKPLGRLPILAAPAVSVISDAIVEYVAQYGGRCRDCADNNGVCPYDGLPCEDSKKAIRYVLNAFKYGMDNGFIAASPEQQGGAG